MLEPIDIDINMKQNISEEAPKAAQANEEMTKSIDSMQKEIERLNKVVVDMSTALAEQRKLVEAGGDEMSGYAKRVDELQGILTSTKKELADYKAITEQAAKATKEGADVTNILVDAQASLSKTSAVVDNTFNNNLSAIEEVSEQIRIQKNVLSDLEQQYISAKAAFDKVNISTEDPFQIEQKRKASKLFKEIRSELELEKQGLTELEKQYKNVAKSSDTYMSQLRKLREEMIGLEMEGKKETPRYRELQAELEKTGTAYRKVQQEQKYLTTAGNATISGLLSGMSAMSGVFSAGSGVMSLFIKDNERFAALQTKLQAAMAITIGLQQVSTALHTTSAFRMKIVARVTNAFAVANTRLAVSLGISTIAAKALMATLTLGLSVAIAGIIYLVSALSSEQEKMVANIKRFNEGVASSANSLRADFEKLRKEWKLVGDDLKKKEMLIRQNGDAYDKLGVSIGNVADADKLFSDNADEFVKSIMRRAKAAAAMEIAAEKYKGSIQKMLDAEKRVENPTYGDKFMGQIKDPKIWIPGAHAFTDFTKNARTEAEKAKKDLEDESAKLEKEAIDLIAKSLGWTEEDNKAMEALGFKSSNSVKDYTKKYYQDIQKNKQKALDDMTKKELSSQKGLRVKADLDEAQQMLKAWDFKDKKTTTTKASPEEKATASLEKMAYNIQKKISEARVKAIHDGAEKERQAAKAEYEQTQAFIEKTLKEIGDIERKTGKPADQQRTMLLALDVESTRQYEAELGRISAQSKATLNDIFTEVNARFASELDQNIADITRYYDQLIIDATKAGATIDEVNRLQEAKETDIDRAGINDQLRKTDLDEALEMEKANNIASIGLTEVAEQTKLEIAKKYLKERIDLLRKLGDESSNKEADVLEARLKGKRSAPKSISGLVNGAIFNKIKKGLENTGLSAEEAQDKTSALFDTFEDGGALAVGIIGDMKGMFGGLDEGLDSAMDAMGNIAEGFASGGPLGAAMAVVSEGIKMFSQYAEVDKQHQEALRKLALAKVELQREYNLLLLKEQLAYKTGSNIFGADQIRGAINSIATYRDAIVNLKKEMRGERPDDSLIEQWQKQLNSKVPQAVSQAQARIDKYKKELEVYNTGIGALADVDIVTGSRKSGWGFWRKQKDTYSKLLDTYDDVIDKEGKLNVNRIQTILNTHEMSDENKALLESLLAISEAVDEASQQLKDYLTDTFGVLGDSLADSIVTAFASGEDAAQLFKGNVTDVLNDIAKQMIFGLYLKDTFDKLEKDIHTAYEDLADDKITEQQLSEKITNILGGFFGGLDGDIEQANKFLEEFWKNAEANGFDRPEGERKGATGGLTNASQDSVNEGVGLLYGVRQMLGDIRQDNREELLVQRTIMGQISLLVERSEYWEHLKELPNVVKKLDSIESYGIKLKV